MKLLIVTQSVDKRNPILGFFHQWISEFSKYFDKVTVVCLEKGEYNFPSNVSVLSLGKETKQSRISYILNFYKYIWKERKGYDTVFVHMNPIYVILGGFFWTVWHKKISLWYTHKQVDMKLRLATMFVETVFSASKESFRLKTDKLQVMGHGIDLGAFKPVSGHKELYTIVSVGRISETKNQELVLEAYKIFNIDVPKSKLVFVGGAITPSDVVYEKTLREKVKEYGLQASVEFVGSVRPDAVPEYYSNSNLFLNLSKTGSLDKAILEAMASGIQVLTSNEAFAKILPSEYYTDNDPTHIAAKMKALSGKPVDPKLQEYVVQNHELGSLILRVSNVLKNGK